MDNKKYKVKSGYVLREIAGEHIAVPVSAENTSDIVVLNPVSALLWNELQSEKTLDELTDTVCSNFDVQKNVASEDIKDFLKTLEDGGVLSD